MVHAVKYRIENADIANSQNKYYFHATYMTTCTDMSAYT